MGKLKRQKKDGLEIWKKKKRFPVTIPFYNSCFHLRLPAGHSVWSAQPYYKKFIPQIYLVIPPFMARYVCPELRWSKFWLGLRGRKGLQEWNSVNNDVVPLTSRQSAAGRQPHWTKRTIQEAGIKIPMWMLPINVPWNAHTYNGHMRR